MNRSLGGLGIAVAVALLGATATAQNIFFEDFNQPGATFTSLGWTLTDGGSSTDTWFINDLSYVGGNVTLTDFDGTPFAALDDDAPGSTVLMVETIESPAFSTAGITSNLFLSYDVSYDDIGADAFTVEVFDGTTWQNVTTYAVDVATTGNGDMAQGGQHEEFDVSTHSNAAMQVRFHYDDGGSWAWFAAVDNVTVFEKTNDVGVSVASIQPSSPIFAGADQVLGAIHLESVLGADVTGLTATMTGTATATDVTNVRLFLDDGPTAGAFDSGAGGDTQLGSSVTNFANPAAYTFAAQAVLSPGIDVIVVADLAISPGDVVGIEVTAAGDVTANQTVVGVPSFPIAPPTLGVFGPVVLTGAGTFTQDFESATQINYQAAAVGPFVNSSLTASTISAVGPATLTGGVATTTGTQNPNSGSIQVLLNHTGTGGFQVAAMDVFFDLSALNPGTNGVTLNFSYADIGDESEPEDCVLLSRDNGATWEAVVFTLPGTRPASYTQETVDLSALVGGLAGANFTDQMVLRFQEALDAAAPNDGTVYDDIEIVVTGAGSGGTGTLSVSGTTNFGSSNVGVLSPTSPATWTLSNTGTADLIVTAITSSNPTEFSLGSLPTLPLTLTPASSATMTVSFTPGATGARNGTIQLVSNTGGTAGTGTDVAVSGSGTPANSPNLVVTGTASFVAPGIGQSDSQIWSISNTGTQDLDITSISFVTGQSSDFSLTGVTVPPTLTLAPGNSQSVTVNFTSSQSTAVSSVLRVVSNSGGTAGTNSDFNVTGQTSGSGSGGFSSTPSSSSGGGDGGLCSLNPEAGTQGQIWGLLMLAAFGLLLLRRRLA